MLYQSSFVYKIPIIHSVFLPFLVQMFGFKFLVSTLLSLQDESNLYIFLEFVTKGSLASLYQRFKLGDSQASAYTRQILHGLNYLHERNVIHR